jgi:hypothetical protein
LNLNANQLFSSRAGLPKRKQDRRDICIPTSRLDMSTHPSLFETGKPDGPAVAALFASAWCIVPYSVIAFQLSRSPSRNTTSGRSAGTSGASITTTEESSVTDVLVHPKRALKRSSLLEDMHDFENIDLN